MHAENHNPTPHKHHTWATKHHASLKLCLNLPYEALGPRYLLCVLRGVSPRASVPASHEHPAHAKAAATSYGPFRSFKLTHASGVDGAS